MVPEVSGDEDEDSRDQKIDADEEQRVTPAALGEPDREREQDQGDRRQDDREGRGRALRRSAQS